MDQHRRVIRNVCIHLNGEQPLLADLYALPSAADAGLLCTNLRAMDGRRPVFVDSIGSTFFFPYQVVRFLEIPEGAIVRQRAAGNGSVPADTGTGGTAPAEAGGETLLPIVLSAPAVEGDGDPEAELEIDEGFLQRIRDI